MKKVAQTIDAVLMIILLIVSIIIWLFVMFWVFLGHVMLGFVNWLGRPAGGKSKIGN